MSFLAKRGSWEFSHIWWWMMFYLTIQNFLSLISLLAKRQLRVLTHLPLVFNTVIHGDRIVHYHIKYMFLLIFGPRKQLQVLTHLPLLAFLSHSTLLPCHWVRLRNGEKIFLPSTLSILLLNLKNYADLWYILKLCENSKRWHFIACFICRSLEKCVFTVHNFFSNMSCYQRKQIDLQNMGGNIYCISCLRIKYFLVNWFILCLREAVKGGPSGCYRPICTSRNIPPISSISKNIPEKIVSSLFTGNITINYPHM